MTAPAQEEADAASVGVARRIVAGLAAGVLVAALLAGLFDLSIGFAALTAPSALLGLVGPVLGYRLHEQLIRGPAQDEVALRARYLRATLLPLAITEAAALLGILSFALGGGAFSLVGAVTHLVLAGALWPTGARLARLRAGAE